jgi:hypothetical protein
MADAFYVDADAMYRIKIAPGWAMSGIALQNSMDNSHNRFAVHHCQSR